MTFFSLSSCIENDWRRFDNTITVTLKDFDGGVTSVQGVVSQPLNKKQTAMVMQTVGVDDETQSFSLPVANLGSVEPQQGHKVVDNNGIVWNVLSCELLTLDTRWMLACVKNRTQYVEPTTFIYAGRSVSTAAGEISDDNSNPKNFMLGMAIGSYFLGKLNPVSTGQTGTLVTFSGTRGSVSANIHSIYDNNDGTVNLNTWLAGSTTIPWHVGDTITLSY